MNALAVELDAVGSRTAREIKRRAARRAAMHAWVAAGRWMLLVPTCGLAVHIGERAAGGAFLTLGFLTLAAMALVPGAASAARAWWLSTRRPLGVPSGLARLDRELHAEGRLQAAHEFLGDAAPTAFMAAAIVDSESHVARARVHALQTDARMRLRRQALLTPLAALAMAALAAWLKPVESRGADAADTRDSVTAQAPRDSAGRRERADTPAVIPPPQPAKPHEVRPQTEAVAKAARQERRASELDSKTRESSGKTGEGQANNAMPMSSSGDSRGLQSTQVPPTEQAETGKPPTQKPKRPKKENPSAAPKKKLEQSGSTAGKGVGSGASKNPGATEWQSKDQVSTDEEQPLHDEQEIDDDSDESEARGGLQPSLRDRRPAVNRDLTIGFGNDPNPDANGRGGPSEQKKSRGVASLVLGVPLPDHVKGQPNPGRIKITQERVEPRADEATQIEASARPERVAPFGPLRRAELSPWMRELVRSYFQKLRAQP